MKRRVPSFLAGVLTTLLVAAMATTALAASGKISYNGATVTVGGAAQAAGDITTAEGQAPGSIQFTDAAGNVTHTTCPWRPLTSCRGWMRPTTRSPRR